MNAPDVQALLDKAAEEHEQRVNAAIARGNDIRRLCFARDQRDAAEEQFQALLRALRP